MLNFSRNRKTLSFILVVVMAGWTFAQETSRGLLPTQGLEDLLKKPEVQALPQAPVLEHAVDPDTYILGPGDVLNVVITGQSEINQKLMVRPEGILFIPAVGNVQVAGIALSDARRRIDKQIRTKYLSDQISITLLELRSFRVTVSGAVRSPGLVTVNALNRVSDAIKLSGGFYEGKAQETTMVMQPMMMPQPYPPVQTTERTSPEEGNKEPQGNVASKRNISIRRRDGRQLRADIQKFQLTGDLDANPCLMDGDVIVVPTAPKQSGQVSVDGAVKAPGKFEFVPGDRIETLIDMAHGFTPDADSSKIEVIQFTGESDSVRKVVLALEWDNPDRLHKVLGTALHPDDRLYVRSLPLFHQKKTVQVRGEVMYPGYYALEDTNVRLSEIIDRAGGFTLQASLKDAYVVRRDLRNVKDPEFERLKTMTVMEMTQMEREYFRIKSREHAGSMGINFEALFNNGDKTQDVILRDDDLIVVPMRELTVNVAGQVINPGLFPYEKNRTVDYYIREAGGYNWNAHKRKVRLIKARTGEWMKPSGHTIVEVGDEIFVPEKPDRNWWVIGRDIVTVLAQLATVYLVIDRASQSNTPSN